MKIITPEIEDRRVQKILNMIDSKFEPEKVPVIVEPYAKISFHALPDYTINQPHYQSLFAESRLCFPLPSDSTLRCIPLLLANDSYYQGSSGTCTYSSRPCRANR